MSELPESADDPDAALDAALVDLFEAAERGVAADSTTIAARHPELAGRVDRFLTVVGQLDRYLAPFRTRHPAESPQPVPPPFGDFEPLSEIGRGGMGVVYRARQRSLNRIIAIKMIRGGSASPEEIRRFQTEAAAVARLDHPHIVPIYETGTHDGRAYFSMKMFEGGNLARRITEFQAQPRRAAQLVSTIARAVHHAHQRGILHRDLKPSNILLDELGEPHVADFGVAKWLDDDAALTRSGELLGTPAYMAPEQTRVPTRENGGDQITVACDVYGLGTILYTLLAGHPPFQRLSAVDTLIAVREQEPAPFPLTGERNCTDLRTICLKCLEKIPDRRYVSAQALADDLDRWQRGEPVEARPTSTRERTTRWCRRNPLLAASAALTAGALICALAALTTGYVIASRSREIADQLRSDAERQAASLRERLYVGQMALGYRFWQRGDRQELQAILDEFQDDDSLQGFEWRWLKGAALDGPRELTRYRGHRGNVFGGALSPDGRLAATCGQDRTIRLWDTATGRHLKTLSATPNADELSVTGHREDENRVAFTPDGRSLISGSEQGLIRLWNLETGAWRAMNPPHQGDVLTIDVSSDGFRFVTAGADSTVRLRRLDDPDWCFEWPGHSGPVAWARFTPDGQRVITCRDNGEIQIWSGDSREAISTHAGDIQVLCATLSPDGSRVALGSGQGHARLWNTRDGSERVALQFPLHSIRSMQYSPDGQWLVLGDQQGSLLAQAVAEGDTQWQWTGHRGSIWGLGFSADSQRILATSGDGSASIWNLPGKPQSVRWQIVGDAPLQSIEFAGHCSQCIVRAADGNVFLVDLTDPSATRQLPLISSTETPAVISPDGHQAAVVEALGRIVPYDVLLGRELEALVPPSLPPQDPEWRSRAIRLAYTADGHLIALRCDGWLGDFDGSQWRERRIEVETGGVPKFVTPDDSAPEMILANPDHRAFELWDYHTGRLVKSLDIPLADVLALAPARRLCAISHDVVGTIQLVPVEPGATPRTLVGHRSRVNSLAFAPDGRTLASGDDRGTVRLWHVATGQELFVLEDAIRNVTGLGFTPDGRHLVVIGPPDRRGRNVSIYDCEPVPGP